MNLFSGMMIAVLSIHSLTAWAQIIDIPMGKNEPPARTLLIPAKNANATVLLFPGGGGVLNLKLDGTTGNDHTFVRSKGLWEKYGIDAVLVDSLYDLGNTRRHQRYSNEHQERIMAVVKFYQERLKHPVWIFGHSMGTASVTRFASNNKNARNLIEGVIVAGTNHTASLDRDVMLPTLAIHHRNDGCQFDPVENSESIIRGRSKDLRASLVLIEGGTNTGDPCGNGGYHGFAGTEEKLIDAAAKFILGE